MAKRETYTRGRRAALASACGAALAVAAMAPPGCGRGAPPSEDRAAAPMSRGAPQTKDRAAASETAPETTPAPADYAEALAMLRATGPAGLAAILEGRVLQPERK